MSALPAEALVAMGIDVGGTSVKGGLVRLDTGEVIGAVVRRATPQPARIGDVVMVIADVANTLHAPAGHAVPLGVALSSDVRDGRHTTGVSLDDSWVGAPARDLIEAATDRTLVILNDADAAALGEVAHGGAKGVAGVVVMLTFGTGIGSAVLLDGHVLPNTGLGQLSFHGRPAEHLISAVARERRGQTWREWATDVTAFLEDIDLLLRPDLFVLGGGLVNAYAQFRDMIRTPVPLVPATLGDRAGILGAALAAARAASPTTGRGV